MTSSPPLLEHHGHAERLDGADEQLPIQPVALPVQAPSHFSGGRGRYIYVVFHGRIPGVYGDWSVLTCLIISSQLTEPSVRLLASPQISGFSGNIHQKYTSEAEANAAYQYAASRGLIRGDDITTTTLPPPYSVVSDERDAIAAARAISPGKEIVKFYVVNPGRRPGIYASLYVNPSQVNLRLLTLATGLRQPWPSTVFLAANGSCTRPSGLLLVRGRALWPQTLSTSDPARSSRYIFQNDICPFQNISTYYVTAQI